MKARLVVQAGEQAGEEFELPATQQGEVVLGRSGACSIRLHDRQLSRRHCRFIVREGRLLVEDLKSKNGTRVNGHLIHEPTELHDGDLVEAGSTVLLVRYPTMEAARPDTITATLPPQERAAQAEGLEETEFAGYRLRGTIYAGQHCVIYRAEGGEGGQELALKVLRMDAESSQERSARFLRGGKLAAALEHENLVRMVRCDVHRGLPFQCMEFAEGSTLEALVERGHGPFEPARALRVARQMLAGLQHVHERRLVMRTVRPDNVLLTSQWHAKLADYDLLRPLPSEEEEEITTVETVGPFDDARFAAPELIARPVVADQRCDLFGIGACLYFMLTGAAPFPADLDVRRPYRAFQRTLRQPRELNPAIPVPLARVVVKAMSPYLDRRFRSAREMLAAIDAL